MKIDTSQYDIWICELQKVHDTVDILCGFGRVFLGSHPKFQEVEKIPGTMLKLIEFLKDLKAKAVAVPEYAKDKSGRWSE